jgi:acyl carrier protein
VNADILEQVQKVLADVFDVPEESLDPDASPETIKTWDSLQHMNMVLAIEERFDIHFSVMEIEKLVSVRAISEAVAREPGRGAGDVKG